MNTTTYHRCNSSHPGSCSGCTLDETKWGKPVPNTTQQLKDQFIARILANPTYLPDSGLMRNLQKELSKLSLSTLANLELLISLK